MMHYLEMGTRKAELPRRFGVSCWTIHRWVELGQLNRDMETVLGASVPVPWRG